MASSIKTVLDLDISKFRSSASEAVSVAGRTIGGGLGKALNRKVGLNDAFKGFVAGIGISVESIAEKLTSGFKAAAEQAQKIAESTRETADIYERIFSGRRTDEQNLAVNQRKQRRLQEELLTTAPQYKNVTTMGADYKIRTFQQMTQEGNPERAAEIAKELASLALEEQEIKKKTEEAQKKSADDYAGKLKELNDLTEKNAREKLSTDEKINSLVEKQRNLRGQAMAGGSIDKLIEAEKLEGEILALKEKQTEEQKKQAMEAFKLLDQLDDLKKKQREARADVLSATQKLTTGRRDQVAFGIDELSSGKRGNTADRAKAREIQRLEDRARRAYDSRGEFRDSAGRKMTGEQLSSQLQDRANQMRKGFSRIKSDEQDPLGALLKEQKAAADHLKSIDDNLKIVQATSAGK